jgi:membrane protein
MPDSPSDRAHEPSATLTGRVRAFVSELYAELERDNVFNGAAALGFYLTLAIFPAMIFVMAVIPYLPIARVDQAIMDLLREAMPARAAEMFTGVVNEITSERRGGLLSLGLAGALWAASTGMYAIMQQMNVAYDVEEARTFVRARATALALTLLFSVLVLGAFSLVVLGGVIQDWLAQRFGSSDALLLFFAVFRWIVIVLSLLAALALIYYAAPNRRTRFRLVTPGTVTATTLLVAASLGFRFYTGHFSDYSATYGSIGAVIVLMLWLYLAGLVMLLGAEIDALLHRRAQARLGAMRAADAPRVSG